MVWTEKVWAMKSKFVAFVASKIIIGTFKALKKCLVRTAILRATDRQTSASFTQKPHCSKSACQSQSRGWKLAVFHVTAMTSWGSLLRSCGPWELFAVWQVFLSLYFTSFLFFSSHAMNERVNITSKSRAAPHWAVGERGRELLRRGIKKFLSLVGKVHHRLTALRAMWAFIHHHKSGTPWCDNLEKFWDMYWSILKSQSDVRDL